MRKRIYMAPNSEAHTFLVDCFVFVWLTQLVQPHYGTIGFVYLFVHESRAPVTWSSIVATYGALRSYYITGDERG